MLDLFTPHLKDGEKILWLGNPRRGFYLRDADIILIPFSIILIGFTVILEYAIFHYDSSIAFKILGFMFALGGIYLGFIRYFLDAVKRKSEFYCITNKRILVIAGSNKKLKTLPLKNIDQMDKTEERDGSGFIIFGTTNPLWPWLFGKFYMTNNNIPGLEMITEVNEVYSLLQNQIKIEISPLIIEKLNNFDKQDFN